MSQTLSPLAVSADQHKAIGQLVHTAVDQLSVTASVGGSAHVAMVDPHQVEKLHASAIPIITLKKHLNPPAAAPAARPLPPTIGPFNTGSITFNHGVPVGGFASLTLHSDGTCTFSGHFHDSGAPSYNIEFVWVIVDSAGNAYTFSARGRMHGTFESGSRDFNWNQSQKSPAVAANWAKLNAGWRSQWNAHVNWDVQAAINSAIDAIKSAGQIVGTVVSVIAIVA